MSTCPYPAYRLARSDWLDSIPSHWSEGKLRWLSKRYAGGTPDKMREDYWTDGTIPWLNSGSVNQGVIREPSTFITEDAFANSSARWVPAGALVMALAGQGKTKGMVAQLELPSTCNQSMAAIVPNGELKASFLYWWLSSNYQNLRNMAGGDNRDGLNLELLGNVGCPIPPPEEQTAIAAFLDRETGKIDQLVKAQRWLIELLKEKRQAVISHAVTKGLDPAAPLKHSGLDLLGEVPAHWEVIQAGRIITEIEQGWSPSAHEREPVDGEPSVLRLSAVKDGKFFPHQRKALPDLTEAELAAARTVSDGDFLLTRANTPDLVGDCAIASSVARTIFSDLIYRLSFDRRRASPPFLTLAFRSQPMRAQVKRDARGSSMSMAKISHAHIKSWWLALPPVEEQEAILSETATETQKLDDGMEMAEEAIILLQERRAALISAAVTGKIDVRGVASEQAEAA